MVDYIKLLSKREDSFGQKLHSKKAHSILIDIHPLIENRKKKNGKFHVVIKPFSAHSYLLTICVGKSASFNCHP